MPAHRLAHHPVQDGHGEAQVSTDLGALNEALREETALLRLKLAHCESKLALFQTVIDVIPDYVFVKDTECRFVLANEALARDHGWRNSEEILGKSDFDQHPRERAQIFFDCEQEIMRSGVPRLEIEEMFTDAAGMERWLSSTKVPLPGRGGVVGVARDITERHRAEVLQTGQSQVFEMIAMNRPLGEVLAQLMHLVESQIDGALSSVLLLDADGVHLRHGAAPSMPAAYNAAIDGVTIGPMVGSCGTAAYHARPVFVSDIPSDPLWRNFAGLAAQYDLRSCWSTPILSRESKVLGTFAVYLKTSREPSPKEQAITEVAVRLAGIAIERQVAEERIEYLAYHDALTGLPNRSLLNDRLSQAMSYADQHHRWVAIAYIDLDNFKLVNDSAGHVVGDRVLAAIGSRMVRALRETDTVIRTGGDEFIVILYDAIGDKDTVITILQNLQQAVLEELVVDGHAFRVSCSIGVSIYPEDGQDPKALMMDADTAMVRAKDAGRNNIQFHASELNTAAHEKMALQLDLKHAVDRDQLHLVYQPQVDLRTGEIFAVEALLRWQHPQRGNIPPDKFIPLAEESGLIVDIGDWVLRTACRENAKWQAAGLPPITVCVNVSLRQFRDKDFLHRVTNALHTCGLEAKYLEIEVTESLLMQDILPAIFTMKELRAIGVQMAIDDFGTGYSNLSALRTFPISRLKIDKSFVRHLDSDENDRAIAAAVISLGQRLNLRVIAEGVETLEQLAILRESNCDEIQGYLFSRPVPSPAIIELLRSRRSLPLPGA